MQLTFLWDIKIVEMNDVEAKYAIKLSFETIELPPFRDILVLAKNAPHGKAGLGRALDMLAPATFETIDIKEGLIEAVFINRQILTRIPKDKIITALKKKVFPFVTERELIRVDFKVDIVSNTIEYEA